MLYRVSSVGSALKGQGMFVSKTFSRRDRAERYGLRLVAEGHQQVVYAMKPSNGEYFRYAAVVTTGIVPVFAQGGDF